MIADLAGARDRQMEAVARYLNSGSAGGAGNPA
jgi:hypothetical protein